MFIFLLVKTFLCQHTNLPIDQLANKPIYNVPTNSLSNQYANMPLNPHESGNVFQNILWIEDKFCNIFANIFQYVLQKIYFLLYIMSIFSNIQIINNTFYRLHLLLYHKI